MTQLYDLVEAEIGKAALWQRWLINVEYRTSNSSIIIIFNLYYAYILGSVKCVLFQFDIITNILY